MKKTLFSPTTSAVRPPASVRLVLLLALAAGGAIHLVSAQQSGTPPYCGNPTPPTQPCGCQPPPEGVNPVNVNSNDVQREIRDLEVFGGVGEHQLNWTRYGHSRLADGMRWFGDGHIWRHSYQYEMVSASYNLQFTYPDGTVRFYTPNNGWVGSSDNPDLLTQSGRDFYLQRDDGFTYHFLQTDNGSGQVSYQLQSFTDSTGNNYTLTYDASNRLALVTEPAGRWLRVTYQDVPVNQDQFTNLFAQTTTPAAGWTEVTVNNPTAFRYLRYFSTEAGGQESYGNVAEVEFYDTAGNKLTGTPFGSSPAWNNGSSTFDKVFDSDPSTFFDFVSPHYGFAGIDLGSGNAKAVGKIRFYPRVGYEARMNGTNPETGVSGCRFEGSNVAPVTESVIAKVEAGYGSGGNQTITRTVNYNYATFADPVLAGSSWLTLTGASYGDGSAAAYTYQSLYAGQRPLLASADDPRMQGMATKIKYEFWQANGNVFGSIYAEHDFTSNQVLAKFEGDGTNAGRKITYANGAVNNVQIPDSINVTAHTNPLGNTTTYAYTAANSGGFLQAKTDPLNHTTSYTRDTQGRTLSTTYADNATESWTRDTLGHVLTHKNAQGNTTTWTCDGNGRPTRTDYPDGGYETFTYNGFGQMLTHRQTNGGTESFTYDGRGMQTGWTDALGYTTTYGYDANDLLSLMTDPLNHTTTYAHNERGQVTQTTYADNTAAIYAYDAYGNQLSSTDELGKVNSATFDAYRRKITSTNPLNRTTQYWYDEPGVGSNCSGCGSGLGGTGSHLTTLISPSGKVTKIGYDLDWHQTSQTAGYNTSAAATTNYAYDAGGNVPTITDARGKVTTNAYDSRNRLTSTTDSLGHATTTTYNVVGNKLSDTHADNSVTSYAYDSMNRRTQMTNPLNQATGVAYGAGNNVTTLTDARNNAHGFTYDVCNRKTGLTYPDGSHENWTYDAAGNVATYTNRTGQVKTSTYDARNRETACTWNDGVTPSIVKSYNATGKLLAVDNGVSHVAYGYDDAGQCTSETQAVVGNPAGAQQVQYGHDQDGLCTSVTYPDGTLVAYNRNSLGQISSVATNGQTTAAYTFDAAGHVTGKTLANGVATTIGYDNAGQVSTVSHMASNGTTVGSFQYSRNALGNVTGVAHEDGTGDTFGYDASGQLNAAYYGTTNPGNATASANAQRSVSMAIDAGGNLQSLVATNNSGASISTGLAANPLNQYSTGSMVDQNSGQNLGGLVCSYDGTANLGLMQDTSSGLSTGMAYNANNQLTAVTANWSGGAASGPGSSSLALATTAGSGTPTAGGSHQMGIGYDGLGRKVSATVDGATTFFTHAGSQMITEQDGTSGTPIARYVGGAKTDEILTATTLAAGGTVYYHQDALGTVTHLTNSSGQVVEHYSYDAYGTTTAIKNGAGTTLAMSAVGNRMMFAGREQMPVGGLYDYRNRAYSPVLGRFTATDPIRFSGRDTNLQRYVGNNPINTTDPDGLLPANAIPIAGDASSPLAPAAVPLVNQVINDSQLGSPNSTEQGITVFEKDGKYYYTRNKHCKHDSTDSDAGDPDAKWDLHTHPNDSPSPDPGDDKTSNSTPWMVNPWQLWRMNTTWPPFLMPGNPSTYFPGATGIVNGQPVPLGTVPNPTGYPHK